MCGIAGTIGGRSRSDDVGRMIEILGHRGPDGDGIYTDPDGKAVLGHRRLSIIDTSDAGRQPMASADGRYVITYNGEVYNYLELRRELESSYRFTTRTDTEVVLAAYERWGEDCLDRFVGMFSFVIWDEIEKVAFAARDRFGVKPFYYSVRGDGTFVFASEIKAIHAAGVPKLINDAIWATFLTYGVLDHSDKCFWQDIASLPGGHCLLWKNGTLTVRKWYEIFEKTGIDFDTRPDREVSEEYLALMRNSVGIRFRSDVPVGINLSGGVDSSALLAIVDQIHSNDQNVNAFTFVTGAKDYDELPWVEAMLKETGHPLIVSTLSSVEVPSLAEQVQFHQDEPFGGLPTLAYAKLFSTARNYGSIVLLDGNGMDEQWGGYDYYFSNPNCIEPGLVQGTTESPTRPNCLIPEFRKLATAVEFPSVYPEKLRNLQIRDAFQTKIPRALRYNDRISMMSSVELREPFIDHRLFELALRQAPNRKTNGKQGKVMLRKLVQELVPRTISTAPKRALQTPQREWLRGELRDWAHSMVLGAIASFGGSWLSVPMVKSAWEDFVMGRGDNSFFVWQWISLGLLTTSVSNLGHRNETHQNATQRESSAIQ